MLTWGHHWPHLTFMYIFFSILLFTWLEIRCKDTTCWCCSYFDHLCHSLTCISDICLFQEWNVTRLTFEYDSEPYGKERDGAIIKMAHEYGVETVVRNTHTLYSPDRWVMNCTRTHSSGKTDTCSCSFTDLTEFGFVFIGFIYICL